MPPFPKQTPHSPHPHPRAISSNIARATFAITFALSATLACTQITLANHSTIQPSTEGRAISQSTEQPTTSPASESAAGALIHEQLDRPIDLNFVRTPLPDVLAQIEDKTGIPLRARPRVWETLPYGRLTPLSAEIKRAPLRDALDALVAPLGLQIIVTEEAVEIAPIPAFDRLGRRATVEELSTIASLRANPLPSSNESASQTLGSLLDRIDATLKSAGSLTLERRTIEDLSLDLPPSPRDSTLYDALELLAGQSQLTWHPWGRSLIITTKKQLNLQRIERTISVRYDGVDLTQVLADLARQSGLDFAIEPGAIQRVPPDFRSFRLITTDATIRQTLESLSAFTGLGYVVTNDGIYVWNNSPTPATDVAPRNAGRILASYDLGNGISLLLRDDQLPEHVREKLEQHLQEAIRRIEASSTTTP